APSRGEGFCVPSAEAMLCGLPVITTAWSGQVDFCNEDTAYLVDYKFARAKTHFDLSDSVWAEPSALSLAACMKEVHQSTASDRSAKASRGRDLIKARFRWSNVADRLSHAVTEPVVSAPKLRVGWISTWNTKCGIAHYSEHLTSRMPAHVEVL